MWRPAGSTLFIRPQGVLSPRESHYVMVDTVDAPDPKTVVFHLKFATSAFLPALADPYSWIYKKATLDQDPRWYEKNILGSGPFKFVEYQIGQSIKGVKNPDYYHKGLPHLDGFTAIYAESRRCGSMRSAPTARRSSSAGFRLRCATSSSARSATRSQCRPATGTAAALSSPTTRRKPFDDARVRRALTLAIDRWHGAPQLAKIANVHTVGGIVFPGSPLAADKEELQDLAGFWPDIEKSRAEAKRLLKEAGAEGLSFEL